MKIVTDEKVYYFKTVKGAIPTQNHDTVSKTLPSSDWKGKWKIDKNQNQQF